MVAPTLSDSQWRKLRLRPAPKPCRLALVNRKGGSGKTTTAVSLAAVFAAWGLRSRLIDGDAQLASATYWLPPQVKPGYPTLADVFLGNASIAEVTAPTSVPGVTIVPSLDTLGRVEHERPPGSDGLLADELDADPAADIELLDAAPSMGLVTVSMIAASTEVALLMTTSSLDFVGLAEMSRKATRNSPAGPLELIKKRLNPSLRVATVVMVDNDGTTTLSREMADSLARDYPGALIATIPHSVRVREAPGSHEPIIDYAPGNPVSMAYWQLGAALVPALGMEWEIGPEAVAA